MPTEAQRQACIDRRRGTAASRGYDSAWTKERNQSRRENPFCELCQAFDILVPPAVWDHIIPHNGPQDWLFSEPANRWWLCAECNSWKLVVFDGGFRGKQQRRDVERTMDGIAQRRVEVVEARRERERARDGG